VSASAAVLVAAVTVADPEVGAGGNAVTSPLGQRLCDAGRVAFFGGKWTTACPVPSLHLIASSDEGPFPDVHLCHEHFAEVYRARLIEEPFVEPDEFDRRRGNA